MMGEKNTCFYAFSLLLKIGNCLNLNLEIYRGSLNVGGANLAIVRFIIVKKGENININVSIILIFMITN